MSSVLTRSQTPLSEMQDQTMTETLCFTGGCRHCCTFLLTSVNTDDDSSLYKTYATDLQSSSCVIWHPAVYSYCFSLLRMTFWQPSFHWDYFWWGSEQFRGLLVYHHSIIISYTFVFYSVIQIWKSYNCCFYGVEMLLTANEKSCMILFHPYLLIYLKWCIKPKTDYKVNA